MKEIKIVEQKIDSQYINLFRSIYKSEKNLEYFVDDVKISIQYCNSQRNITTIILTDNTKLIGHCSLIQQNKDSSTASFGFFDLLGDKEDCKLIWNAILLEAKKRNIKALFGPINGSIWLPYRFISNTDGSPLLKGELPTNILYNQFMSDLGYAKTGIYHSYKRDIFNKIITTTEQSYTDFMSAGYTLESADSISSNVTREIYDLSNLIFSSSSVLYDALPFEYFLQLYNSDKLQNLFKIYIARKNGLLIGFCTVFTETDNAVVFKTLAIHPDFRQQGIGNALVYKVHKEVALAGYSSIVYALIREGNNIQYFPKDDIKVVREYLLYTISI
jgi:GNAT superfamily N-acetyltransferase